MRPGICTLTFEYGLYEKDVSHDGDGVSSEYEE